MKTIFVNIIFLLLLALTMPAKVYAKPMSFYVGGGITAPSSNFNDTHKNGFNAFARVGFSALPKGELLIGADIHTNTIDKDAYVKQGTYQGVSGITGLDGGRFTTITVGADAKFNLGLPSMNPYVIGGIGFASINLADITIFDINNQVNGTNVSSKDFTKFYIEFGGGLEFNKIFLQLKWMNIFDGAVANFNSQSSANMIAASVGFKI